jgi:tetratricopeptide (TPR) repeat protein
MLSAAVPVRVTDRRSGIRLRRTRRDLPQASGTEGHGISSQSGASRRFGFFVHWQLKLRHPELAIRALIRYADPAFHPNMKRSKPEPAADATTTSSRLRHWLIRIIAVLLVPGLLCFLELGLRVAGYGYDPHFFKRLDIGGKPFWVQNEDFSRRFFPPETIRQPNALRMRAAKPTGAVRIFIFGESAAMGDPEPGFGPARFLEVLLQQRFPGRDFEVVNVAFTAINSHVLLPLAKECAKHEGDLWIIYMGNNEMVGPYGAATILGVQAPPRALVRLVTALQATRIGQMAMSIARKTHKPVRPSGSWGGMAMFQNQRVAPLSPKRQAVYKNYAANLNDIIRCGLDSGAGIILSTMAVNLHDSPPFASLPQENLPPAEKKRFDELFAAGIKQQNAGWWSNAASLFGQVLEIDPHFAEAHYRRAACLEKADQPNTARKEYQLACDTDALPFRTDSRMNESIRVAASRYSKDRLQLLDTAAVLAKDAPSGVSGQESFYEHVHFNIDGAYRLGLAWAQAVEKMLPQGITASPGVTNGWASQGFCERRLGLTDWNRKLIAQSVLQRLRAPPLNAQFNNPERVASLVAYERGLLADANEDSVKNALGIFAEAIAARPEDHHVLEAYAVFLQSLGNFGGAIKEWQKVGELLPHDFLPWFQIGSLLGKQGNLVESEKFLRKALVLRPGLVEGWNELGQCLGARGDWQPALAAFEHGCELRPEDPVLWAFRAKILASLNRRDEAIDSYRKAVALNPAYAEAHAALGDQYSQAGRIPEAIASYQTAIATKTNYAMAHLNLGLMFGRQRRWDDAANEFRKALLFNPGDPIAQECLKQAETHLSSGH